MKILVVAHPDDEVLWFAPGIFDKIIIVFCDRHDKVFSGDARRSALKEHPLNDRIINLNMFEPGYWKDNSRVSQLQSAKHELHDKLQKLQARLPIQTVFTHNSSGEYGHDDHILVHNVCKEIFNQPIFCPKNMASDQEDLRFEVDHQLYGQIKEIYSKHRVWTWEYDYLMPDFLGFKRES